MIPKNYIKFNFILSVIILKIKVLRKLAKFKYGVDKSKSVVFAEGRKQIQLASSMIEFKLVPYGID